MTDYEVKNENIFGRVFKYTQQDAGKLINAALNLKQVKQLLNILKLDQSDNKNSCFDL